MQGCKYMKTAGCETCNCVYFQECPTFKKVHAAWLTRSIRPFVMKTQEVHNGIVWSSDMNKAKSVATQYALRRNAEVVKLSLNQLTTIIMQGEEIDGKVYYVEILKKGMWNGEDKTISVLSTFLGKCGLQDANVAVYVAPISGYKIEGVDRI